MVYECKYCGKEYENYHKLAGHSGGCRNNPKSYIRNNNLSIAMTKRKPRIFNCIKCGKEYIINITERKLKTGDYRKHCSYSCSNSRIITKETKEKISSKLIGKKSRFYKEVRKPLIKKLFGTKCFFCGFENDGKHYTCIHRKDGKKHKLIREMNLKELKEINPDEYIRLCPRCHDKIHWCMRFLGMNWEEIEKGYNRNIKNREGIVEQLGSSPL